MTAVAHILKTHREQRFNGYVTTGCSCGWCPNKDGTPLLTQWAEHVAAVVWECVGIEDGAA